VVAVLVFVAILWVLAVVVSIKLALEAGRLAACPRYLGLRCSCRACGTDIRAGQSICTNSRLNVRRLEEAQPFECRNVDSLLVSRGSFQSSVRLAAMGF